METFLVITAVLFGLIIGSFLNVVIYRLPRGQSVARPRSRCPECLTPIPWYRNIPVLSFVLLGGRCAYCRKPISWRYPLVEAFTAFSFWMAVERFGFTPHGLAAAVFLSLLIALGLIDLEHQILPDPLTLGGAALFSAYSFINPEVSPLNALGSALGSALLFYGLLLAYLKLRKIEGLGMGDVKMMLLLGAFLGYERLIIAIFLASLSGLLVGLWLIAFRHKNLRTALPFGTFLSLGAFAALFWGRTLLAAMQSFFS
jgi:leader peptidase (prepilin peptidase) / N-methyltransferase